MQTIPKNRTYSGIIARVEALNEQERQIGKHKKLQRPHSSLVSHEGVTISFKLLQPEFCDHRKQQSINNNVLFLVFDEKEMGWS